MIYFKINTYIRFVINQMTKHIYHKSDMKNDYTDFHISFSFNRKQNYLPFTERFLNLSNNIYKKKKKKSYQIEHYKFEKLFHSKLFFSLQLSREKIIPEHDRYTKISYYLRIIQNIYNIHKKFIPAGGEEITYAASISISWKSHASTNGIVITTDHLLHFFPRRTIPPCLFLEIDEIRYFFLPSSIA